MTEKLQLMLINVLLDQFLNTKVSQGSVATRLRCDGILNDQYITQSLLSQKVKEILKIGQHLLKLWAIKHRVVFFMKYGVYVRCVDMSLAAECRPHRGSDRYADFNRAPTNGARLVSTLYVTQAAKHRS